MDEWEVREQAEAIKETLRVAMARPGFMVECHEEALRAGFTPFCMLEEVVKTKYGICVLGCRECHERDMIIDPDFETAVIATSTGHRSEVNRRWLLDLMRELAPELDDG